VGRADSGSTTASGLYRHPATISYGVIGFYLFLVILLLVAGRNNVFVNIPYLTVILSAALLVFLARYLSTRYWMDSEYVGVWRLFGSRKVRLDDIRKIEFANLRDLGPVGIIGTWGWRGRVWSPVVGRFDATNTVSEGILIASGQAGLFISPKNPIEFARELSRRARSYDVVLETDAGAPGSGPAPMPSF
jgi:hypothetical protein